MSRRRRMAIRMEALGCTPRLVPADTVNRIGLSERTLPLLDDQMS
jgi:hypothetical protein